MRQRLKNIFGPLTQPDVRWFIPGLILATAVLSLLFLNQTIDEYYDYLDLDAFKLIQESAANDSQCIAKRAVLIAVKTTENDNYSMFGNFTYMVPPPLSVFDLNPSFDTIKWAHITVGGVINIRTTQIHIFTRLFDIYTFSGILLYIGSFLFGFIGFIIFNTKAIVAVYDGVKPGLNFFSRALASLLTVIILDGIFIAGSLILCHYKGLTIPVDAEILHIYLLYVLFHTLALSIGALGATLWPYLTQPPTWRSFWIVLFIMLPAISLILHVQSTSLDTKTRMQSVIIHGQLEQMRIFNEFFRKLQDLLDQLNRGSVKAKQVQDMVSDYLDNGYKNIEEIETLQIKAQMDYYTEVHRLRKYNPYQFFQLMLYEITGNGGNNSINFNIHLRDKNRRYLKTIIDNVYFPDEQKGKTYFTDAEPLYFSRCYIPGTIYQGMGVLLCYIAVFLLIVYFRLRIIVPRELARVEKAKEREKEIQEEWQKYMDMYKREKEKSGNQELILAEGGALAPGNV